MQIFQDGSSINPNNPGVPTSPVRQLYGKKKMPNGTVVLIAPLDIVLMQYIEASDTEVFAPPAPTGALISYNIATPVQRVGTIIDYEFPPSLLDVIPVVRITPDITFDLTNIPEIGTSVLPAISIGDTVILVDSDGGFLATGTLLSTTPVNFPGYPNGPGLVKAFQVNFGLLLPQVNGARVLVGGTNGSLLGMLITSSLVFPADKI